jgi:hypothetical protein
MIKRGSVTPAGFPYQRTVILALRCRAIHDNDPRILDGDEVLGKGAIDVGKSCHVFPTHAKL